MRARPALVLFVALLGISTAGPLVRLSHADPLAIASWRLAFSLIVVGAAVARNGGWRQWARLGRRDLAVAVGAGVLLALHFWSWNASIGLTTIAASVVLVNMQPAFVALASAAWLHERPERRQTIGIAVAIAGAFVVALPDLLASHPAGGAANPVLGDLLALVGAVTAALYYAAGRRLRQTLDLWPYVGLVYGACLVTLLAISLSRGVTLVGLPGREYAIFAALAAGPMLLGHTGMNWALKFLPAYVVNLTVLGEPVGATLLAAMIPGIGERPTIATLVGGALLLGGVLATSGRARVTAAAEAPSGAG